MFQAHNDLFNAHFQDLDELHRRLGEIRYEQRLGLPQSGEVFYRAYGSTFEHTSTRSFTISVSRLYSGRKLEGWAYTNDATDAFSGCTAGAA
jgi:hypothetical protein